MTTVVKRNFPLRLPDQVTSIFPKTTPSTLSFHRTSPTIPKPTSKTRTVTYSNQWAAKVLLLSCFPYAALSGILTEKTAPIAFTLVATALAFHAYHAQQPRKKHHYSRPYSFSSTLKAAALATVGFAMLGSAPKASAQELLPSDYFKLSTTDYGVARNSVSISTSNHTIFVWEDNGKIEMRALQFIGDQVFESKAQQTLCTDCQSPGVLPYGNDGATVFWTDQSTTPWTIKHISFDPNLTSGSVTSTFPTKTGNLADPHGCKLSDGRIVVTASHDQSTIGPATTGIGVVFQGLSSEWNLDSLLAGSGPENLGAHYYPLCTPDSEGGFDLFFYADAVNDGDNLRQKVNSSGDKVGSPQPANKATRGYQTRPKAIAIPGHGTVSAAIQGTRATGSLNNYTIITYDEDFTSLESEDSTVNDLSPGIFISNNWSWQGSKLNLFREGLMGYAVFFRIDNVYKLVRYLFKKTLNGELVTSPGDAFHGSGSSFEKGIVTHFVNISGVFANLHRYVQTPGPSSSPTSNPDISSATTSPNANTDISSATTSSNANTDRTSITTPSPQNNLTFQSIPKTSNPKVSMKSENKSNSALIIVAVVGAFLISISSALAGVIFWRHKKKKKAKVQRATPVELSPVNEGQQHSGNHYESTDTALSLKQKDSNVTSMYQNVPSTPLRKADSNHYDIVTTEAQVHSYSAIPVNDPGSSVDYQVPPPSVDYQVPPSMGEKVNYSFFPKK